MVGCFGELSRRDSRMGFERSCGIRVRTTKGPTDRQGALAGRPIIPYSFRWQLDGSRISRMFNVTMCSRFGPIRAVWVAETALATCLGKSSGPCPSCSPGCGFSRRLECNPRVVVTFLWRVGANLHRCSSLSWSVISMARIPRGPLRPRISSVLCSMRSVRASSWSSTNRLSGTSVSKASSISTGSRERCPVEAFRAGCLRCS